MDISNQVQTLNIEGSINFELNQMPIIMQGQPRPHGPSVKSGIQVPAGQNGLNGGPEGHTEAIG